MTYTRQDGQTLTLPSVAILKPDGDKVGELRVFMDVAPIYGERERQKVAV